MTTEIVYLIRHSIPQHPPMDGSGILRMYGPEADLTPEGETKAAALAQKIFLREAKPLDILVTSPYLRAEHTALILAAEMGIKTLIRDDRLHDTASTWKGVALDELVKISASGLLFSDPHTLETMENLGMRMKAAYDQVLGDHPDQKIGIVSHGDPLRLLYFQLLNPGKPFPPYRELFGLISLDTAQGARLEVKNGEVSRVEMVNP